MIDISRLQAGRQPKNLHEAASMLQILQSHIKKDEAEAIRLSVEVIKNRFEQGRIVEQAVIINSTSANGETVSTYGKGLIDALAAKADVSSKVLRQCHALYKRAGTREAFYKQLARWEDAHISISWNHCVNWANKALPASKEKAEDKIDKEIRLIERTLIKAKDRLLNVQEQVDEWDPDRADELLGVAQAVIETIQEVQTVKVEGVQLDKPTREEDTRYLAFVRERPCSNCGAAAPSEPHHVDRGGTGTKGSDLFTIPICRTCHDQIHQVGERAFWQDYNVWQIVAQTQRDYIRSL